MTADTKTSVTAKKAWLKDHMQDTKQLLAAGTGAGLKNQSLLQIYQDYLRREWDRLDAIEKAGEAAGWRE